ncbi:MAG TPA: DUF1287 domain-containing protein [Hyphomicrobium sp.]|nr:DUF1287 domain-containing protein [Hyphomicrobium sp.]
MKKPRKPKPKAGQHRPAKPAAAPPRAHALPRSTASPLKVIFLRTEQRLSAVTSWASRLAETDIAPALSRIRSEARALALPYSRDEREALALLFLPFLLVASAVVVHQSVRALHAYVTITSVAGPELSSAPTVAAPPAATPPSQSPVPDVPADLTLTPLAPAGDIERTALLVPPDTIETREADEDADPAPHGICAIDQAPRSTAAISSAEKLFGVRLAEAAEAQVGSFVVYNDAYRTISYPKGDVPGLFGVCSDVVVRAYRALGLDLQELVHQARAGRGDASIDHRRVEGLRRFLAQRGETLPVTSFAEDYRPGDIVTYHRPQNRGTQAHIAIVSSVVAPSGRLMIVHNRGWGPQLEDALFVDEITGHYRYAGPAPVRNATATETSAEPSASTASLR